VFKPFLLFFTFVFLFADEAIYPIPQKVEYDLKKAQLGKKLFFDTKLSKDNTISCASCHLLDDGGDDNLAVSFGIAGQKGHVNSPTVINSVFNFRQFWNGRARTLEQQVRAPIENPIEMGHNIEDLVSSLKKDNEYKKRFNVVYENGITFKNIANAIAEFEKTLITPNSPFDRYLMGDQTAITKKQKEGYELFKEKGCTSCHNGINVGGNLFSKIGVVKEQSFPDKGLVELTGNKFDEYLFKVPSLRMVVDTAPYLHDGSIEKLDKVIKYIAKVQVGIDLSDDETQKIEAFFHSLKGELEVIADE
jgi:cytochrome c peroxidase